MRAAHPSIFSSFLFREEPLPERVPGTIRTVLPESSLQCGPPLRPSPASAGPAVQPCLCGLLSHWQEGCVLCLARHRAQGRSLLLSSGEFLSLQQRPLTPPREKAAVLMALRPQRGLLPLGLCLPHRLPLWVRDQLFLFHFRALCVSWTLGVDCQQQKPPLKKLVGQWWHLLAHRAKCRAGGAGSALGWLEPGTRVSLSIWL